MTKTEEFIRWLQERDACSEAIDWVRTLPPDAGVEGVWAACPRLDWMLWLAHHLKLPARPLQLFAIDCARSALHHTPAGEDRPRLAVEAAEQYLAAQCSRDEVVAAARAAWVAADAAWARVAAASSAAADAAWTRVARAARAAWAAAEAAVTAARVARVARVADAAWAASWAAADADAARDTARSRQADMLRKRTEGVLEARKNAQGAPRDQSS